MKKIELIYIVYYLSILLYIFSIFSKNIPALMIITFIYKYGYQLQAKMYRKGEIIKIIRINIYIIILVSLVNLIILNNTL
jgi:hypothetical protein